MHTEDAGNARSSVDCPVDLNHSQELNMSSMCSMIKKGSLSNFLMRSY